MVLVLLGHLDLLSRAQIREILVLCIDDRNIVTLYTCLKRHLLTFCRGRVALSIATLRQRIGIIQQKYKSK